MVSTVFVCQRPQKAQQAVSKQINKPLNPNDPDHLILSTDELKIGIEEIRRLKTQINIKPSPGPKVVVILDAEKLTIEAQNALLKTIEEPPANTQIFLQTKNAGLLLATILSRCQIVKLPDEKPRLTDQEKNEFVQVYHWLKTDSLEEGFAWAASQKDRAKSLAALDKLLVFLQQTPPLDPLVARKIFRAKKYLQANTNVRLTLENLFL